MLSLIILSVLIFTAFTVDNAIIPYIQDKIEKRSEVIEIFETFLKLKPDDKFKIGNTEYKVKDVTITKEKHKLLTIYEDNLITLENKGEIIKVLARRHAICTPAYPYICLEFENEKDLIGLYWQGKTYRLNDRRVPVKRKELYEILNSILTQGLNNYNKGEKHEKKNN